MYSRKCSRASSTQPTTKTTKPSIDHVSPNNHKITHSTTPMPPKLHGALSRSLSRLTEARGGVFYCPSCTTWRRSLSLFQGPATTTKTSTTRRRPSHRPREETSSILSSRHGPGPGHRYATSSAVNITRNVPPRFKELHSALDGVGEAAATHVNLSRLHLAQRGLESERPVIRIAGTCI